jgi:hypothetical protein
MASKLKKNRAPPVTVPLGPLRKGAFKAPRGTPAPALPACQLLRQDLHNEQATRVQLEEHALNPALATQEQKRLIEIAGTHYENEAELEHLLNLRRC